MYAAVVKVTVDAASQDPANTMLVDQVVPMVKASPGFIAGYWLALDGDKGLSIVIFDTEENALKTAPPAGSSPGPGVTVDSLEIREVAASA